MKTIIRSIPLVSWLLAGFAVWHGALAVTTVTALVMVVGRGDWSSEWAWLAVREAGAAVFYGWVAYIVYDNTRMRRHPMWAHVDKAWQDGYFAATRSNGAVR